MTHNELRDWIGEAMESKGFHRGESGFAADMMVRASLIQTEVCEAMQEVKRKWGKEGVSQDVLKDDIAIECADVAIRAFDLAWMADIDLDVQHTLERPADYSRNERHSLIIRLGKINTFASELFGTFQDCADTGDDEDHDGEGWFKDSENGLAEEVQVQIVSILHHLDALCRKIGRNLNNAIDAKMEVNMKRPARYGTPDEEKVS